MHPVEHYQDLISEHLLSASFIKEPGGLYQPIDYILSLGGKRIRPVLTLMTADVFGGDCREALPAAMAVEVFHNFSLVHDDIMDDAPLRRGKKTVHEKWDINTAILSGDAMLIMAYRYFEQYEPPVFRDLAKLFSKTALEVCEGQQWDMDFEERNDVALPQYLKMIEYKTAVLVGAALKMGAIVAGTSEENGNFIYDFGLNLGMAFQLQDDYLDAFGDPETFGKQVGGDILADKKTYLYIKALESAGPAERELLIELYESWQQDKEYKIKTVKGIFVSCGADKATQEAIKEYTLKAFAILEKLDIKEDRKLMLRSFGENLMKRKV